MGWEYRGAAAPYYYRKVRDGGGQVRSVYVGKGPLAECMAEMDGAARAARRYHAEAVRQTEAVLDGAGEATEALTSAVKARLGVHMSSLGFRYHRGDWRRPRATREAAPEQGQSAMPGQQMTDGRALRLSATVPSTRQIGGISDEANEAPQSELDPRIVVDMGQPEFLIQSLRCDAWGLRVMTERAVMGGDGHKDNRVFRAFAAAARSVVEGWGGIAVEPVDPDDESPLERRRRDGRVALGRTSAARPHAGSADETALAVAAVLDEVGQDGRDGVTAALHKVRGEMGWTRADPLGRAVIDQYALAQAHADLVTAFDAGSAGERARQHCLQGPQRPGESDAFIEALGDALGPLGAASAARAKRGTYSSAPSPITAWKGRTRRMRRLLADAARLVRHARKAGLVPDTPSDPSPSWSSPCGQDDPLVALARPAPLAPLAREAAECAAALRAGVDARRAAWPPPNMVKWDELSAPTCVWSIFDYTASEVDPEGRPHDGSLWAVQFHPPEHPDDSLASLASWAPEYAVMS